MLPFSKIPDEKPSGNDLSYLKYFHSNCNNLRKIRLSVRGK